MTKLSVPSSSQLMAAYHHLISKKQVSLDQWIQYSKLSRFDPRIAEAWLKRMLLEWKNIAPVLLREKNLASPITASMGVLLEQIEDYLIDKKSKKLFRLWKDASLLNTPMASGENFLIGIHPFSSNKMKEDAEFPLRSFSIWGFSGSEIFINKALSSQRIKNKTELSNEIRLRKLDSFISQSKKQRCSRFIVEDYLHYCNYCVSRRVAQMDLKQCKRIQSQGATKARTYLILR